MAIKKGFKPGDIAQATGTKVFVTGAGDESIGYDCFAGIVIEIDNTKSFEDFPLGMFSNTWTLASFEKAKDLNGDKIMQSIVLKAAKWDALDDKIGGYYVDENGDELEGEGGGDLCDIGAVAASAFGYL